MPLTERQHEHFPPKWYRLIMALAVAVAVIVVTALKVPAALWFTLPMLGLGLIFIALHNPGLILTDEGIEWYVLNPQWTFRKVPWRAVLDVRRGLFGFGPRIDLIVIPGRYEPWVWGTPRRHGQMEIDIWPNCLVNGEEFWDAIHLWWSASEHEDEIAVVEENDR